MCDLWRTLSREELLNEYMPSRAVVREGISDPVDHFITKTHNQTSFYRRVLNCSLGISYNDETASDSDQRFDWFLPSHSVPDQRRIFVYLHGGFWQESLLISASSFAGRLTDMGYTFVSLGYDLADPEKGIDIFHIIRQVRRGVKAIIDRAKSQNIDSLILTGHSAGAHLAAMILANVNLDQEENVQYLLTQEQSDFIRHAIFFDGIYDLRPIALIDDLNEKLQLTESTGRVLSPSNYVNHIARQRANILLITGGHSNKGFQRQNEEFSEALSKAREKLGIRFHFEEDIDHFDMIENLDDKNFSLWVVINKFLSDL